MCLATPGKVLKIEGEDALVDFDGIQKEVNISLVSDAKVNEYLIVHAGFAIQKMGEDETAEVLKIYEESKKISKHTHQNKCSCEHN